MAGTKTSALTALTTIADGDLIPVVDVSDTTMAPTGTTKKAAASNVANFLIDKMPFVDVRRFGAIGDGVVDDTVALQAAAAATAVGGTLWFPPGVAYKTAGTLTIGDFDVKMPLSTKIVYTGTGTAVVISPSANVSIDVSLHVDRNTYDWDDGVDTTSIGVLIKNAQYCRIRLQCKWFHQGVVLRGDAGGCVYNEIDCVNVADCKKLLTFEAITAGWANDNKITGKLRFNSGYASYVATRSIDMSTAGNGNLFEKVSLEGNLQERTWVVASSNNVFLNCRLEAVTAGTCEFTAASGQNWVLGGYDNINGASKFLDNGLTNRIDGTMGAKMFVGTGSGSPEGFKIKSAGSSEIVRTTVWGPDAATNNATRDEDGAGTMRWYSTNKATNPNATVEILGSDRGIKLRHPTSGATVIGRVYALNTTVAAFEGTWGFNPDNTSDFGVSGARPRDIRLGRNLIIGGALDHDGTTAGFFNVTPVSRPTAYTQTYATADKTLAAYTPDDESAAYTGATDGEAKLVDLNALRVAYENLRAFAEDLAQQHNSMLDDLQALGLLQ